ncbi:hypothetical protein [Hymenobacter cheonanensis]|uniref:hypothetical protein n=1 Tax=Hymenobacter sp. CA2-7 TaxID=3063993 RepID=UPI002712D3B7|nr:hypothetical protein [Hymenobacter sp. CA2-7]MDO7887039.1 hypothetical protein [Hymenobacter sp. CA2-7]
MLIPRPAPDLAAPAAGPTLPRRAGWGLVAGAVLLLLAAVALLAYLLTPYPALRDWYLHHTPFLYRGPAWPRDFFTPAVKARGNLLAGLALATLGGVGAYGWWGRRRPVVAAPPLRLLSRADWPWLAGLLGLAAGLWAWGATQVPPAYDEVFSAVYCAGNESLLATWSYYMLPNNHVLFNLLNGGLFGWLHRLPWLVPTGRLLSGLAYASTLAVVFRLVAGLSGRRWAGALLAVLAGLQFSLWGFGFQARGYALYALLHWVALAALLAYWRRPRRSSLVVNALAVAAGYATVPTFLFYHAAQLLAGAVVQARQRRFDGQFWLAQVGALALAGVFYLPAIGFSGLAALAANPYVRPFDGSLGEFIGKAWPDVKSYAPYAFGEIGLGPWLAYGLALLPLGLLAHRRYWRLGLLYGCWLLAMLGGTLGLRHVIFHRNLLALFSLAVVLAPLAVGVLLGRWHRWAGLAGALAVVGVTGLGFVRHNPVREPLALYYYDLTGGFEAAQQRLARLPAGTTSVGFSEESFYPYFLYLRAGGQAPHPAQRPAVATDYYLTAANDALPPSLQGRYQPVDTVGTYRLWRRASPAGH